MTERPPESAEHRWKVFGERTVFSNRWVNVTLVDVAPPDGRRFEHHAVRLQRVAAAVVIDADGRVLLLWRHRFITDSWGWELPGGIVDAGEDAATSAAREVEEETGWRPGTLTHLVTFQPMPGLVDTPHEVWMATEAEPVGPPTSPDEAGVVRWVPLSEVPALLAQGELAGASTLVGLLHVLALRRAGPAPTRPDKGS